MLAAESERQAAASPVARVQLGGSGPQGNAFLHSPFSEKTMYPLRREAECSSIMSWAPIKMFDVLLRYAHKNSLIDTNILKIVTCKIDSMCEWNR